MTTAEIANLESDFLCRARELRAAGNLHAAAAYSNAAALLIEAESNSLSSSLDRSRKRRSRKLGLRLTR